MDNAIQSIGDVALTQSNAPMLGKKHLSIKDIDKTSQDFEAMFISQMFQPMFESVGTDPNFGGGHGEDVMRSFLVQEYGKIAAKSGHLGIAAHVKDQMIKMQDVGSNSSLTGGQNVSTSIN
jgi:Rod binding domain-containing protein